MSLKNLTDDCFSRDAKDSLDIWLRPIRRDISLEFSTSSWHGNLWYWRYLPLELQVMLKLRNPKFRVINVSFTTLLLLLCDISILLLSGSTDDFWLWSHNGLGTGCPGCPVWSAFLRELSSTSLQPMSQPTLASTMSSMTKVFLLLKWRGRNYLRRSSSIFYIYGCMTWMLKDRDRCSTTDYTTYY